MNKPFETKTSAGTAVGDNENARATKVVSSLSSKMAQPGGLSIADIERRTNERLQGHKADAMKAIERSITELEYLSNEDLQDFDGLYRAASAVLSVAGFFDTGPLYDAVYSLCDTIEGMKEREMWKNEAVHVHVSAIRLIMNSGCQTSPSSQKLMAGLKAVREHAKGSA